MAAIDLKNSTIGMLLRLKNITNITKMYSTIQSPTLDDLFEYINSTDDALVFSKLPEYEFVPCQNFIYTNLNLKTSKQLSVYPMQVDDFYTESFYNFVLSGYHYLHATPIFTIANIDLIQSLTQLSGKLPVRVKREYIDNDVYYKISDNNGNSCILFLSHYNIRSLYRTTHESAPINQLYILTQTPLDLIESKLIKTICLSIDTDTASLKYITHDRIPYHLFRIDFISHSMTVEISGSRLSLGILNEELLRRKYTNVILGQSILESVTTAEISALIRYHYLPDCFVWRKIHCAYGTQKKDKLLLILTLDKGMTYIYINLIVDNFRVPKEIAMSHLPEAVHFDIGADNRIIMARVTQTIYYIPTIKCVFASDKSILNCCENVQVNLPVDEIQANTEDTLISAFSEALQETHLSTTKLFEHKGISLIKINFSNIQIITFTSLSDINVDVTQLLNNYISAHTPRGKKNTLMINNLFTLFNISS